MTFIYIIGLAIIGWAVYRYFVGRKDSHEAAPLEPELRDISQRNDAVLEVPITVTVRSEKHYSHQRHDTDVDKDAWEGSFWEVQQPVPARVRLKFNYVDASNRKSERTVDVRQFGSYGDRRAHYFRAQ